jgi:multidrug efflux pump subunit AcrB
VTTEDVVALIKRHGLTEKNFRFFDSEDQFMKLAAKTPRSNCVLDTTKAEKLKLPMRPIAEALESAMRGWVKTQA